jgi:O-antigen/teichoic acid export membrane protein
MTLDGTYRRGLAAFARVAGGKIFALGSLFVTGVLVARASGPENFGFYSAGLALVLMFDAIVGQPVDNSLIRFSSLHRDTPDTVLRVQGLVFRAKLAVGVLVLIVTFLMETLINEQLFGAGAPRGFALLIAVCGVALLATRSLACSFQIRQEFGAYARLDLAQAVLRTVLVLILFAAGVDSPLAYLGVHAIGGMAAFGAIHMLHPQRFAFARRPDWADTKRLFSYTGATSVIVLFGTITGRADIPVLAAAASPEVTGHYSAAMQIAFLGMLLASYAAVVTQPKVVELASQHRLGHLIKLNVYAVIAATMLYVPVAFGILPALLPWIFGAHFTPSVPILQILLIGTLADLLIVPVMMPYAIQAYAKQSLIGEAIVLVLFIAGIAAMSQLGAIEMAWLVTGVRFAKLAVYSTVVARHVTSPPQTIS